MVSCPPELKQLYRDRRIISFIGAGASMSVQWTVDGKLRRGPSWEELVNQATRELGFETADLLRIRGTDLQILEYFKLMHSGQTAKLTNWLVSNMNPGDEELRKSVIHRRLVELDRCNLFYTTNYDNFLERSFLLHGRGVKVIVNESDMASSPEDCQIVKFHGDWNNPDKMVLTESDYENRLKLSAPMDYKIRADILGRAILFIGYSFRDPNVSYLFRLVSEQFGLLPDSFPGRRAYILVSDPSIFETRLFNQRNIEVIHLYGNRAVEDISSFLEEMRS